MALGVHEDWLAPLFADSGKFSTIVDELKAMVEKDMQSPIQQLVGIDALRRAYTDVLGGALAMRMGSGYISITSREEAVAGDDEENDAVVGMEASTKVSESFLVEGSRMVVTVDSALVREARILLCSVWVDRADYLLALLKLLSKAGAVVVGLVSLRFDGSREDCALLNKRVKVYARSMTKPIDQKTEATTPPTTGPRKIAQVAMPVAEKLRRLTRSSAKCKDNGGEGDVTAEGDGKKSSAAPERKGRGGTGHSNHAEEEEGQDTEKVEQDQPQEPQQHDGADPPLGAGSRRRRRPAVQALAPPLDSFDATPTSPPSATPSPANEGPSHGKGKRRRVAEPAESSSVKEDLPWTTCPSVEVQLPKLSPAQAPGLLRITHTTSVYEANSPGEDRYVNVSPVDSEAQPALHLFAVFDGHGGSRASEYASQALIREVLDRLKSAVTDQDVKEALRDAFLTVDDNFLGTLDSNATLEQARGYWNAGCCALLAALRGGTLFVAHTGDCRAVLGRVEEEPIWHEDMESHSETESPSATPLRISPRRHPGSIPSPSRPKSEPLNGMRKTRPRRGINSSTVRGMALSSDHNCTNEMEVELVKERSTDPSPIRKSQKDLAKRSASAVVRVAGSLAVTRAIGDAYLKRKNLSFEPYKSHVPYITSEPEVTMHFIDPHSDRFLILATDGLWERLGNDQACAVVEAYLRHPDTIPASSPSEALVEEALGKAANANFMSLAAIKKLSQGPQRRTYHDDICCSVIVFGDPEVWKGGH